MLAEGLPPIGLPARSENAKSDSFAEIARGTGLGRPRPFRKRAGAPAISYFLKLKETSSMYVVEAIGIGWYA